MSGIDKVLEGPFTYDVDRELSIGYDEDDEIAVSAKDQPVISLMYALMKIYNSTVKKDYEEARRKIAEVNELWNNLDMRRITSERISTQVLKHIKDSTLYYFHLINSTNSTTANQIFQQITDSRIFTTNTEIATFYGCRAIGWTSFHESGHQQALIHAKKASALCRECPLWHFVLYKNHRITRRKVDFSPTPSVDEKISILACVNLSVDDPFYCLHAGQMYREEKDYRMAMTMFRKVYEAKPESSGILLRLALGLLRCKQKERAKELLDLVENKYPNDLMFLHYKGLYLEVVGNFEEAAKYFLKSAKGNNYAAHFQYAHCRKQYDENFDCVQHLKTMMETFPDKRHVQQLWLHVAMQYVKRAEFEEACRSFVKGIEVDRNSNQMKNFNNATVDYRYLDIFEFVKKELVPQCADVEQSLVQRLLDLCQ